MTVEPLPPELAYRPRSRAYPLIMIALLALLIAPVAVVGGSSLMSAAMDAIAGPPQIVIENQSTSAFVAWLTADEIPPPDADGFSTPPRFGFDVAPRSTALVPRDHTWATVEIWTMQCEVAFDSSTEAVVPTRVTLSPDGTIIEATSSQAMDHALPSVQATSTQRCVLLPWMPPTPSFAVP